jgi:uncharacterized protein DUF3563
MNERERSCGAAPGAEVDRIIQRFRRWWRHENADEQYLAGATDLADAERRMRVLERASRGPMFRTFNH